jgi:hypothetical protein
VLTALLLLLLGAGVVTAAPAAAVDDPTRPDARVTHGPSCRPGGLVVEVTAGESPYFVRLATTREPGGEDEATLAPGETIVLRSDDVDWGETIDGRLEYAARDGSGTTYVDELDYFSFTRPSREDCDAIRNPPPPEPVPPTKSTTPSSPSSAPSQSDGSTPPAPTSGGPSATPTSETGAAAVPTAEHTGGSGGAVAAGDPVTLRGAGFQPGERVDVRLHGSGEVLGTAVAGADGTVDARVHIPTGTAPGTTTVDLVGAESALVADVQLRVAGASSPVGESGAAALVPLVAAAGALVGSVAALVAVAGRRLPGRRSPLPHA